MPRTETYKFAYNNTTHTFPIEDDTSLTVTTYMGRQNTLNLSTAPGTGPFTVTVNFANAANAQIDKLVVGSGINLKVTVPGRWSIDARDAASTDATFDSYLSGITPSYIGSANGPNTFTVTNNTTVTELTGGNGVDTVTVAGSVGNLNTGTGTDSVTVTGSITTLKMGSGANTLSVNGGRVTNFTAESGGTFTLTNGGRIETMTASNGTDFDVVVDGTSRIGTATLAGSGTNTVNMSGSSRITDLASSGTGTHTLTLNGTSTVGNIALSAGTGTSAVIFGSAANTVDTITATGQVGAVTLSGNGTVGRLATGAGNDVYHITDTDFDTTWASAQVATGAGNDSLTFSGGVTMRNIGAISTAIDTGTGNDAIRVTANTSLNMTGVTARNVVMGDGVDSFTAENGATVSLGTLSMGAGNDTVSLTNTILNGNIDTGADNDTVTATGGRVDGSISTGDGVDIVTLSDTSVTGNINTGIGNDTLSITGGAVTGSIDMGADDDTVTVTGAVLRNDVVLGAGADNLTVTDSVLQGSLDAGAGNDTVRLNTSTTGKLNMGAGNDTLVINGGTVTGNIDMGEGTDSLTLTQDIIPTAPDLAAYYQANPSVTIHGDIDLGSGGGIQTLNIGDGALINGTIFAGKSVATPVNSNITIGDHVTIRDSEYSMSLGNGDDVVTIGDNTFIGGQILLNAGTNTLHVGENTWLSSSNVAVYGGTGDDTVTLSDGVLVKGTIALSGGNNSLYVGSNVTFTESAALYTSADLGDGGKDLLDFGRNVLIRGDIFTGWGNDIVSMTEGALGAYTSADRPVVSAGIGGETGDGDMLIIGDFFDTGLLAGKYEYNSDLALWFAIRSPGVNHSLQEFVYNGVTYRYFETIKIVPTCFTPGTLIATVKGLRAIETIAIGDLIPTRDNGLQPVRKVLRTSFDARHLIENPRHQPVRIAAGALGGGLPERDLVVSPQHRILLRSRIAERVMGSREVLTPAVHLIGLPGITRMAVDNVIYLHLVFDRHELIISEGAVTEAFYPGPAAVAGMDLATQRELAEIFPDLATAPLQRPLARPEVRGRIARDVLGRHAIKNKPLVA